MQLTALTFKINVNHTDIEELLVLHSRAAAAWLLIIEMKIQTCRRQAVLKTDR